MHLTAVYKGLKDLHAREVKNLAAMKRMGVERKHLQTKEHDLDCIAFAVQMVAARLREARR
jgi:hypothetical protein